MAAATLRASKRIRRRRSWASSRSTCVALCSQRRGAFTYGQFYGLCTIACVGASYMVGSLLGSSGWRVIHRKSLPEMELRNQQFQAHLSRFRADPSRQSVSNPVRLLFSALSPLIDTCTGSRLVCMISLTLTLAKHSRSYGEKSAHLLSSASAS